METVTIELNNSRAYSLLKGLEELDLLRIVRQPPQANNMADLLSNCISSEQATLMNKELKHNK